MNASNGRTTSPGHQIESSWFILEHAKSVGNDDYVALAERIFNWAFEKGWDKERGGILCVCGRAGKAG